MKFFLSITLTFFLSASYAQVPLTDSIRLSNAERDGKMMAKLLLEKNYKEFAKYTYPGVVALFGGAEKIAEVIKSSMEEIEEEGFTFTSCSVERPTGLIYTENEIQCTITQLLEMKTPTGRVVSKSTLIGISGNKGESWTFVDSQGKDIKTLQEILPNLSDDLVIPTKERIEIEKD